MGGGAGLSEGEKSLVVVSRALYARFKGAKILVLDEATAKLDEVTERRISHIVGQYFIEAGITVVAVAHQDRNEFSNHSIPLFHSTKPNGKSKTIFQNQEIIYIANRQTHYDSKSKSTPVDRIYTRLTLQSTRRADLHPVCKKGRPSQCHKDGSTVSFHHGYHCDGQFSRVWPPHANNGNIKHRWEIWEPVSRDSEIFCKCTH